MCPEEKGRPINIPIKKLTDLERRLSYPTPPDKKEQSYIDRIKKPNKTQQHFIPKN